MPSHSPATPSGQAPHPSPPEAPLASGLEAEASGGPAGPADTVRFDVNEAVDRILDEGGSRYVRALHLYEFCCAVYLCVSPPEGKGEPVEAGNFAVDVPRRLLRTARAVAAMRLMRSVEVSAASAGRNGKLWRRPFECPPDPDYASLYEVFWRNGRWETVRHVAELGDVLRRARWEAQLLGRTLDFSVRFEPSRALPRTTGGITAATRYVPTDKYFRVEASTSTLLEYWSRRRRAAVWYYLTSVHKLPFGPPLPSQQRFASSLLDRLAGADLKAGFALYNLVHERLGARGYELPKVACRTELPEASWTPEGLPKEVLERLSAGTRGRAG